MNQPLIAVVRQARAAATAPRPLLIGEMNPLSTDPDFALYPRPANCAGERLCRMVFGLREATYLDAFERANLLVGDKWSAPKARAAADRLRDQIADAGTVAVLCGAKVAAAFGVTLEAPSAERRGRLVVGPEIGSDHRHYTLLSIPHPSGLCRRWHEPGIVERCRDVLREAIPGVPFGEVDHG